VCPARDTGVALVMTRIDTAAMNLFLVELSQAVAPGAHGIVLMDKAGWHTASELRVPENLSLVFLPPYSPEHNPIERLWLHLRDNRLSHCVFQTTQGIIDSCCRSDFDHCLPRGWLNAGATGSQPLARSATPARHRFLVLATKVAPMPP
jgi:transposase